MLRLVENLRNEDYFLVSPNENFSKSLSKMIGEVGLLISLKKSNLTSNYKNLAIQKIFDSRKKCTGTLP